jgi:opacity protein-like surface antigen
MLLVGSLAHAKDIDAGAIEIGGKTSAAFAIDLDEDNRFDLGLDGFYYLMPNIGVGGFFDYTKVFGDTDTSSLALGPEGIYIYSLDDAMSLYGRGGVGYVTQDPAKGDSNSGWSLVLGGGIKYFLVENFSLNGELNYTHKGGDFDSDVITALFGISVYFQ